MMLPRFVKETYQLVGQSLQSVHLHDALAEFEAHLDHLRSGERQERHQLFSQVRRVAVSEKQTIGPGAHCLPKAERRGEA